MRIFWIQGLSKGKLGMMARPKGGEWLQSEVDAMQKSGVEVVISLLETREIQELGLEGESMCCENAGMAFRSHPMPDRGVPSSESEFRQLLSECAQFLGAGKSVVVHCRMGIGRTGMFTAATLIKRGWSPKTVFLEMSRMRGLEMPDTPTQKQWILDRDWIR